MHKEIKAPASGDDSLQVCICDCFRCCSVCLENVWEYKRTRSLLEQDNIMWFGMAKKDFSRNLCYHLSPTASTDRAPTGRMLFGSRFRLIRLIRPIPRSAQKAGSPRQRGWRASESLCYFCAQRFAAAGRFAALYGRRQWSVSATIGVCMACYSNWQPRGQRVEAISSITLLT